MQYQCVPASSPQTLDEFHAEHHYPCFLYGDKAFISFGISPTSKCEIVYRVKELGTAIDKDAPPPRPRGQPPASRQISSSWSPLGPRVASPRSLTASLTVSQTSGGALPGCASWT